MDISQIVITVLIAVISSLMSAGLTFAVMFMTVIRHSVSRDEMERRIKTGTPWVQDKGGVMTRISHLEEHYKGLNTRLENLAIDVGTIKASLAGIDANLKLIVARMGVEERQ